MARHLCLGLVLALFVLYVSAKGDKAHTTDNGIVIISTTTEKTITSTTSRTTTAPTTTTSAPTNGTTSTAVPTTSVPTNATTSTAAPTTSVPTNATTSTTAAPTTPTIPTSSQAPTSPTTPGPSTTTSKPSDNTWVVIDGNEKCILAKMNITLRIKYNTTEPKELHFFNGMEGIHVSGSCGNDSNTLVVTDGMNLIEFDFSLKNGSTKHYYLSNLFVKVDPRVLNMTDKNLINMSYQGEQFLTQVNNSYECSSPSPFKLNNTKGWEPSELMITDVTLEAFRNSNDTSFSSPVNCITVVPDIVPIVVGCILALLVVIILVGYLIGRKRSQSRGYTSM